MAMSSPQTRMTSKTPIVSVEAEPSKALLDAELNKIFCKIYMNLTSK